MQNSVPMVYHILNGDSLSNQIQKTNIDGEYIICRECLIDGSLEGSTLSQFWDTRSKYISETYAATTNDYFNNIANELKKLIHLPENSEVYLWFEDDLFCQANMWFIISLLVNQTTIRLYRIFPILLNEADRWKGFSTSTTALLEKSYEQKVPLKCKDIKLGSSLWNAYKTQNFAKLKELSSEQSSCFNYLEEVCQAHIERFPLDKTMNRPEKVIKELLDTKSKKFQDVFHEFSKREGIYGFGDLQIKTLYDKLITE